MHIEAISFVLQVDAFASCVGASFGDGVSDPDISCEGCLVVRSGHGPQAEVAQGVGPGPLVEL